MWGGRLDFSYRGNTDGRRLIAILIQRLSSQLSDLQILHSDNPSWSGWLKCTIQGHATKNVSTWNDAWPWPGGSLYGVKVLKPHIELVSNQRGPGTHTLQSSAYCLGDGPRPTSFLLWRSELGWALWQKMAFFFLFASYRRQLFSYLFSYLFTGCSQVGL